MRNLKKFLALVLAMVMAFSLMLSASAADKYDAFKDTEEVTDEFVEAVKVLSGLEVIKGDGEEDNKKIRPGDTITRAEAAALVYRIATGDVSDRQVAMYSDYSNFTDVKARSATDDGDWFAGYVGYCQNAGIIKGTTPTTFNPYGKVTGYEVLAMILRAVGYGKNNEFTGGSWQVNVASLGKTKHITDSVTSAHLNYTLNMPATREIVAELLFRGSLIPQVKWTPGLGYVEYKNGVQDYIGTLAGEVFGLGWTAWKAIGDWGEPGYEWTATRNPGDGVTTRVVATIMAEPEFTTTDLMRECDLAEELEITSEATFDLYVNSKTVTATDYRVVATDTLTKVGGQGRLVKVYRDLEEQRTLHWFQTYDEVEWTYPDTIVMVDTVLAKVTGKTDAVLDAAGHVITPAKLYVDVYDQAQTSPVSPNPNKRTISKGATSKENWEYSRDDMLLLNSRTDKTARTTQAAQERAAFETDVTVVSTGTRSTMQINTDVWIVGTPESKVAKQTTVYWNQDKHNVDNKDELDALTLYLDKAGTATNTNFTWYFDQYNNLIGIDDGSAVQYGVITSVYAAYKTNDANNTDGSVQAIASVTFADGSTGTVKIDRFLLRGADGTTGTGTATHPQTPGTAQANTVDEKLTDTTTTDSNTVEMKVVYDVNNELPLTAGQALDGFTLRHANQAAWLRMAPNAIRNSAGNNANDTYGILVSHDTGHMFKFINSANDEVTAIQVAGLWDKTATRNHANENTGVYEWLYSGHTTNGGDGDCKLVKSTGALNITSNGGAGTNNGNITVWADNETQIIVRDQDNYGITTYKGISALPGDVALKGGSTEVSWADPDNDGRAEYLYVTGKLSGVTTYGLFVFNRRQDAGQWNGDNGTISGHLNGEATTLNFVGDAGHAMFDTIMNATNYNAGLFAIRQFNGVVNAVLTTAINDASTANPLIFVDNTSGDVLSHANGLNGVFNDFMCGKDYGNNYQGQNTNSGDSTRIVYYHDAPAGTANSHVVSFVSDPRGDYITIGDPVTATYYFTPNTDRVGIMDYLNGANTVNDVVIVYEKDSNAILDIYVISDTNITPSVDGTYSFSGANVLTPSTSGAADTCITTGMRDVVVNSSVLPSVANINTALGISGYSTTAKNLLFFPFSGNVTATLSISKVTSSGNELAYQETVPFTNDGLDGNNGGGYGANHTFVIDWTDADNNPSGYNPGVPLTAGDYIFRIVSSTGATLSSGAFTVK